MSPAHRIVAGIAALLALALGFAWPRLPAPVAASAPDTEFSAERALAQLRRIAARPHPTGTSADDEVRDTIVEQLRALGFTVHVQDTTSLTDVYAARWGLPVVAAHVRNVVARRAGRERGPALMLMAHYDSREVAPGASDDGFGVVTLLETARALAASPQLRHDLVLLFTEGEEQGLMGARAFFADSAAASDVGLVLNFEARGDRGPVFMFQTSEHAASLVDAMASAAPDVVASSLSQEVYRRMPNDTDLTVALQAGVAAMNFANLGGFERYHQSTDTVDNASAATLQHHGSYALALARMFGEAEPLVPAARGDEVYFDFGPIFIHYRTRLALPLAMAAALLGALAFFTRAQRRPLRIGGSLAAIGIVLAAPVTAAAVAAGVGWLAGHAGAESLTTQFARDGVKDAYDGAMATLGAAVAWGGLAASRSKGVRAVEMAAGTFVVWAALALALAALLPGGSFLYLWPAAAMVLAAAWPVVPVHGLVAMVTLAIVVPLARQLGVVFGPSFAPAIAGIAASATIAAFPLLEVLAGSRRWSGPVALATASLAVMACAIAWPAFDPSTPRPDSLLYVVDADQGKATWRSTDRAPDAWTSSVLSGAARAAASDVFPRSKRQLLTAPAPPVDVGRPGIEVVSDSREGDTRTFRVHVQPPPGAEALSLSVPPGYVTTASVEGRPFATEPDDGWLDLAYFGPPPWGLDVTLTGKPGPPIPIHLVAQLRGLPGSAFPGSQRPSGVMPGVGWNALFTSDMTLVTMSYTR
ncbi:MAG TPA: M20/M25/M40 family metallo-hydrolase [Polyangiaceae bacterium]